MDLTNFLCHVIPLGHPGPQGEKERPFVSEGCGSAKEEDVV